MSRLYIFPPSEEDLLGTPERRDDAVGVTDVMAEGDHLVRRYGSRLRVWRVGDDGAEHVGDVALSSLPEDARQDLDPDEVRTPDDASTLPDILDALDRAERT